MAEYIDKEVILGNREFSQHMVAVGDNFYVDVEFLATLVEKAPAADVEPVRQWISVKTRLPEDEEGTAFYDDGLFEFTSVLAFRGGSFDISNRLMIRENNLGVPACGWSWSEGAEVTHWMPLPDPPPKEAAYE